MDAGCGCSLVLGQVSKSLKKDERVGAVIKTKFKVETPAYRIKLTAPAGDAKSGGTTLTAILGFHTISLQEFCSQFNQLSEDIVELLPIPVVITKKDKLFSLKLKEPTLETLLFNATLVERPAVEEENMDEYWFNKHGLDGTLLFDIILIKRRHLLKNTHTTAKIVLGTLRSFKLSRSRRLNIRSICNI